jgi:CheY-like chemotaxis protein
VLLIDTAQAKRELRAEVMKKLGIDVDCAADIAEARSWWKAAFYDLVLINMEKGRGHRDKFCDDMRSATPPQRLAFFVGQPEYLADAPNVEPDTALDGDVALGAVAAKVIPSAALRGSQRWGILEASRRISEVRSAFLARTQAIRALPTPPRDSEVRVAKKSGISNKLDDLLREELQ